MPNFTYHGGVTAALSCTDIEKSLAWYKDVLGFKLRYHVKEIAWAEMETATPLFSVGIGQSEKPVTKGGGAVLTFGVQNIDTARAELEKKGVKFDGPTRVIPDMVKLATFYDPDDNAFMFFQDLSPAQG